MAEIPEPNIQATNIPTGGGAQVNLNFVAPDNAFANLSKTLAGASQTFLNFKDLEDRENKSKEVWQEQIKSIKGLKDTGDLSQDEVDKIVREANAKAQKEGIIRAHENWSTMKAVEEERSKLLHNKKTAYFKMHMGSLTNPDENFAKTYEEIEEMFEEEYAETPVATDSQGNDIFAGTEGMTPMQLVTYSNSRTAHKASIEEAIEFKKDQRSKEATAIRVQSNIAELYKMIDNTGEGVTSEVMTMPSIDHKTGKRFESYDAQLLSAYLRGEIIRSANLEEASEMAQSRSEMLDEELKAWEEINQKSAIYHPRTGRPIYHDEDGVPYSEISETYFSPQAESLLAMLEEQAAQLYDADIENPNQVLMTSIESLANEIIDNASLGDKTALTKVNDLIYVVQRGFSHMTLNGEKVMFAPVGTKSHETLDAIRASATKRFEDSQKLLSSSIDESLDKIIKKFRTTIRGGQPDNSKKTQTYEDWVTEQRGIASDEANEIKGFSPSGQAKLLRDLKTISDNLSFGDESQKGITYFNAQSLALRKNLSLTEDNFQKELDKILHSDDGDLLTQQQYDDLTKIAEDRLKANKDINGELKGTDLQDMQVINSKVTAYSDIDKADRAINVKVIDIKTEADTKFFLTEAESETFDIVSADNAEIVSKESTNIYDALIGDSVYKKENLDDFKYLDEKGRPNKEFRTYLLRIGVDKSEIMSMVDTFKMLKNGINFKGMSVKGKSTAYSKALDGLETYMAYASVYEQTLDLREEEYDKMFFEDEILNNAVDATDSDLSVSTEEGEDSNATLRLKNREEILKERIPLQLTPEQIEAQGAGLGGIQDPVDGKVVDNRPKSVSEIMKQTAENRKRR
tara:strand:+ start:693 stop:3263 length:2571 start_codon:yes stop_codon:yes gene_type:complete